MRASFRPVVLTLVSVGAVLTANAAHADVVSGPCDPKKLDCSNGIATLHAESRDAVVTSIGTGWLPKCAVPDAQGHCGSDEPIQVSASIDLAAIPGPSTEPLWLVDMARAAVVDARWPTNKGFELTTPTSTSKTGTFKVSHTLIPEVRVYATLLGFTRTWTYSTAQFLADNAANYKYQATNTSMFFPWAMPDAVENLVKAPPLSDTTLIDTAIINDTNNEVKVALAAKTNPKFTYRTTKVTLGEATPIAADALVGKLPMVDADFLDLKADVVGEITVEGELFAAPYVWIKRIGGVSVPGSLGILDLTGALDAPSKLYNAAPPVTVTFPQVTVHIPLPNLKAPKADLDLGSVELGKNAEKPATIKNTGELGATMGFKSSDPQFTVTAAATSAAKTDYALMVRFTPTKEGAQSATITMRSNDPDSPEQSFEVHANGTPVPVPPAEPAEEEVVADPKTDEGFAPRDSSGCGCYTTPATSSYSAVAGLGLVGLLVARRRRARS